MKRIKKIAQSSKIVSRTYYFLKHYSKRIKYCVLRNFVKHIISMDIGAARDRLESLRSQPAQMVLSKEKKETFAVDLSIIVPVYNVEKYVDDCIQSLVEQKTKYSYEIIIVEDGSTDHSAECLKKWENKSNIKLLSQQNAGVASARNRGIACASGRYLMFVDSDDKLEKNAVEAMLKRAIKDNIDIVQGQFCKFDDENHSIYIKPYPAGRVRGNTRDIMKYPGQPWGKIYKAELFEQVRFPVGIWFEDTIVHYLLFRLSKTFACIDTVVYDYRDNVQGYTHSAKKSTQCLDTYWVVEEVLHMAEEIGLEVNQVIYNFTLWQLCKMTHHRCKWLEEEVLQSLFIVSSDLIWKMKKENKAYEKKIYQDIEKSFLTKNYALWKLCAETL